MSDTPPDLSFLLDPVTVGVFFAQHWERQPLHLRDRDPDRYASLISVQDIDALMSSPASLYPTIRLAKGGAFFAPAAYTQDVRFGDDVFNGVPDAEKIFTEYMTGATVSLRALHRLWPPMSRLCGAIERQLDHGVHANAYVTPPNSPGFTAHYDTHDVFVLQLAGRKTWRIDAPPIALPHRSQPFAPQDYAPPPEPWGELELAPGDLLYLPRGWVHSTRTSDGFSAHVTLGVSVYTWVDLVSELMQAVINAPELRCALPPGFASREELRTQLKDTLGSVIDGLGHRVDRDRLLDAFTARVRASRARPSGRFRCDVSDVTLETTLQAARKPVISQDGEHCIVELDGRRILLPRGVTPMLTLMFDSAMPFRADILPGAQPSHAKLSLVRYLHALGLLRVAS